MYVETAQASAGPEAAKTSSEPISKRRVRDNDEDTERVEPQRKRKRTTASAAPSQSTSDVDERATSSLATPRALTARTYCIRVFLENALAAWLQVDHSTEQPLRMSRAHQVRLFVGVGCSHLARLYAINTRDFLSNVSAVRARYAVFDTKSWGIYLSFPLLCTVAPNAFYRDTRPNTAALQQN